MKRLFIIIALFLIVGCVSNQHTSYIYDSEIFPIIDPIYPEHKQCDMDAVVEVWTKHIKSKIWAKINVSNIKDSLFIKVRVTKMIIDGRTLQSEHPPLASISALTDHQGNIKEIDAESHGLKKIFSTTDEELAIIIENIKQQQKEPPLNKGPLKTGDILCSTDNGQIDYVIDGYSYYKNKKVIVVSVNNKIDGVIVIGYGLICPETFYPLKLDIVGKKNGTIIIKLKSDRTIM